MIRLGSRSKSTEVVADGHADMPKKLLLVNSGQIGRMKHGPLRSLSSLRFFPPFPPCYHALNSCFLRKFGSLSGCPQAAANSELPCPHFSAGERKLKYPGPGFGYSQESAVQIEPIYFLFFSVPQCLRGAKVLSLVAASSRCDSVVQRSCHSTVRLINPTMFGANARIIAGTFSRNGA